MSEKIKSGRRATKILVGFSRNAGSFVSKDNDESISFDNVTFFYMDFADTYRIYDEDSLVYSDGFVARSAKQPVESDKIKLVDFEEVVGVPYDEFVNDFREHYFMHPCSPRYTINEFDRMVLCDLPIIQDDVFTIMSNAKAAAEADGTVQE